MIMKNLKFLAFALIGFLLPGVTSVNADINLGAIADEIAPGNVFRVNTTVPTTFDEFQYYIEVPGVMPVNNYADQNVNTSIYDCNVTYTTCTFGLSLQGPEDPVPVDSLTREVNMVWKPTNQAVKNRINSYVETLEELRNLQDEDEYGNLMPLLFDLTDLSLINYFFSAESSTFNNDVVNKTLNYSESLRTLFNNANLTYTMDFRAGDGGSSMFDSYAFGGLVFHYNGVPYGVANDVGLRLVEAIYVPNGTALTDAALIAAATSRINAYLPGSNITITAGEAFNTYTDLVGDPIDFSKIIDTSKTNGKTYIVNFGTTSRPFVIVADSSKMTNPKLKTTDLDTNVSIGSDVTSVPLDSIISVDELDEESEEYQRLAQLIGATNIKSYDLALFSETKNSNITRLESGKFQVSIPIPAELEGKRLIVYYVNAQDEKEAHAVTIKDGLATFETDHFSTYSLTENTEEENPQTYDATTSDIIIGIISLIGLASTALYINNKRFN